MCRSCVHPFHGKYCQQCETCGHPAHDENFCGVGVIAMAPHINGDNKSIGCTCKEERYER